MYSGNGDKIYPSYTTVYPVLDNIKGNCNMAHEAESRIPENDAVSSINAL